MADAPQEELAAHRVPRFRLASGLRRHRHESGRSDSAARFLTAPTAVVLLLYLLTVASLGSYSINNDSAVYFDFMRRLVGLPATAPPTAQFGSAVFTFPFFLVARGLDAAGLRSLNGAPVDQISMVVAAVVAVVLLVHVAWRLLERLELPSGPTVIVLTVVGTPLFYYAALLPTYKHAFDTLFVTAAVLLLYQAWRRPSRGALWALGGCMALMLVTRSANAAMIPGLLLPFVLGRRFRATLGVLGATIAVAAGLYAVPLARGIELHHVKMPKVSLVGDGQIAASSLVAVSDFGWCKDYPWKLTLSQCLRNKLGVWVDPAAPVKMLVTPTRGLFLWTPLTALATVGFVLLTRRRRDLRPYLLGLGVAALGLLLVHMLWGDFWDNGFSFSQRFLTALFPVFLLGTAELVRRWRRPALAALSVCALFSLGLAFTFFVGYKGIGREDGVGTMVKLYVNGERTPQQLVRRVGVTARERWLGH